MKEKKKKQRRERKKKMMKKRKRTYWSLMCLDEMAEYKQVFSKSQTSPFKLQRGLKPLKVWTELLPFECKMWVDMWHTLVLASKGAPRSSSSSTDESCPLRAAQWSGVRPSYKARYDISWLTSCLTFIWFVEVDGLPWKWPYQLLKLSQVTL